MESTSDGTNSANSEKDNKSEMKSIRPKKNAKKREI